MAAITYKIGFVLDDGLDKPDGVQQYILTLGSWLERSGHEVHYLVGQTKRRDIANVHSLSRNVPVSFNGNHLSIPLFSGRRRLMRLLKAHHFDVLHVQVPYSPFMAQRLLKLAPKNTAIIGTFHIAPSNWLVHVGNFLLGIWLKPTLGRFDKMLSVSTAAAEFAQATFRIDSEVLPNVIDYHRFATAKPLSSYTASVPTILFLGRLVPRKGSLILLEAVRKLHDSQPKLAFRLVICGSGPLAAKLAAYIHQHQLQEFVEMVGFVSEADKPRYYASADIGVFPSSGGESFGIVLIEAMASGRAAVLAGDNPGYRSVMKERPELLFNPHNSDELAHLLLHYLKDVTARQAVATWSEKYAQHFDVSQVGTHMLDYYEEALRKKGVA